MEPDATNLDRNAIEVRPQTSTPPVRMGEETRTSDELFKDHHRLVEWVLANDGYLHPGAQIAFSQHKGFHAVVGEGQTLSSGTRIASCPMPVTLSVLNALDITPFSSHGSRFPDSFLRSQASTPESLQAFFLMEQLVLGEESWWAPYIATIPSVQDVSESQFEEAGDVIWLEGTNLRGGFSAQTAKWKEMYLQGMGHLRRLEWPNALQGAYTWYV